MPSTWQADEPNIDPEFEDIPAKGQGGPESTEKLAVVSLAAGILGFFLPVVGPVTAIVSGHVARGEIRKSRGRLGGDALARTGLILGYIWVAMTAAGVGVLALAYRQMQGGDAAVVRGQATITHAPGSYDQIYGVQAPAYGAIPSRVYVGEHAGVGPVSPVSPASPAWPIDAPAGFDPDEHDDGRTTIRIERHARGGAAHPVEPPAAPAPPSPPGF